MSPALLSNAEADGVCSLQVKGCLVGSTSFLSFWTSFLSLQIRLMTS